MKKLVTFIMLLATITVFNGCGEDDKSLKALGSRGTNSIALNNIEYHLPDGVKVEKKISDSSGAIISSGDNQDIGGFIYENKATYTKSRSLESLKDSYQKAITSLQSSDFMNISYITQQEGNSGKIYIKGDYDVTTYEMIKPVDLVGKIIKKIALDDSIEVPVANESSMASTNFTLTLQANEYIDPITHKNSVIFIATVVSKEKVKIYKESIKYITNYSNITRKNANIQLITDTFIQTSSNSNADFLFVVDNSPSMKNDQDAVSRAGEDFKRVMLSTGLDVNFAIITTDQFNYDELINQIGVIKNDYDLFKQSIIVGDNGNDVETGIYDAEKFLTTQNYFPRSGVASLSVVIISDEESQYTKASNNSFDPSDNLFIDRNIRVYSIIDTSMNSYSQYDDLSIATGGIIADIEHTNSNSDLDFSDFMRQVASDAVGRTSRFVLKHHIIINRSTTVMINGKIIVKKSATSQDGWVYEQASNSIVFYGNSKPKTTDKIEVTYEYDDTGLSSNANQNQNYQQPLYIPQTPTQNQNVAQVQNSNPATQTQTNISISEQKIRTNHGSNFDRFIFSYSKQGAFVFLKDGRVLLYGLEDPTNPILEKTISYNGDIKDIIPLSKARALILTPYSIELIENYSFGNPYDTLSSMGNRGLDSFQGYTLSSDETKVYIGNITIYISNQSNIH